MAERPDYNSNVVPFTGSSAPPITDGPRLKDGGGDGTSDGMDHRVTRLEVRMENVDRTLGSIDGKLDRLNDRLGTMATRRDLETWRWQWLATGFAILALTVGGITGGLALIAGLAR